MAWNVHGTQELISISPLSTFSGLTQTTCWRRAEAEEAKPEGRVCLGGKDILFGASSELKV